MIHAFPLPMLVGLLPALALGAAAARFSGRRSGRYVVCAAIVAAHLAAIAFLPTNSDSAQDRNKKPAPSPISITALAVAPVVIFVALGLIALANRHGTAGHIAMGLILLIMLLLVALIVPFAAAVGAMAAQIVRVRPGNSLDSAPEMDRRMKEDTQRSPHGSPITSMPWPARDRTPRDVAAR